jgi:hypothetical protein
MFIDLKILNTVEALNQMSKKLNIRVLRMEVVISTIKQKI